MRLNRRQERGAASVEAAISMIVIIPTFMYALFMDDLLRYASDLQEAVVSTPWDFTGQNFMKPGTGGLQNFSPPKDPGGATEVQHQARLMFCDHESSGDSYDRGQDCDNQDHHKGHALAGHVCWLNDGARQVTCDTVQSDVGKVGDGLMSGYGDAFASAGGLYECHAKEVVENYLLPKTFLEKFSGQGKYLNLTKENWKDKGGDIHGNAEAGNNTNAYYLAEQRFAVLADPWALNEGATGADLGNAPENRSGTVYDRVDHVFKKNAAYGPYALMATTLAAQGFQKNLMSNPAMLLGQPTSAAVAFPKKGSNTQNIKQGSGSADYYSTPWRDWNKDPYKATHSARGGFYMGCKTAQKENCL